MFNLRALINYQLLLEREKIKKSLLKESKEWREK